MKSKFMILFFAVVLFVSYSAHTQNINNENHIFMAEVDPIPYLLGGVGGHFGWIPKKSEHFAFGIGFISGPEFPDAIINMDSKNKNQGWHLKINQGMGLWTQYYFKEKNQGWFAGLQLFTQEMELSNDDFPGETNRTNVLMIALQVGYVWYPLKKARLYIRPWAGFGYQDIVKGTLEPGKVTPDMVIGNKEYNLNKFMPFATFHIGYVFNKK